MKYDVKVEFFDNLYQFIDTIDKRPKNSVMSNMDASHKCGETNWYKTGSYEESVDLMRKGWQTGADKLKGMAKGIKIPQNIIRKNVKGFFPSVPDALTGKPKAMFDRKRENKESKTLTLCLSNSASCDNTEEVMKIGAICIDVLNAIESSGVRCNVYSCPMMSLKSNEIIGAVVKVKDSQQPLNLKKVAYLIGHVSFFRRQGFRYLETAPGMTKDFSGGYGSAVFQYNRWSDIVIQTKDFINEKLKNVAYIDYAICKNNNWDSQMVLENLISEVDIL